MSTLLTVALAAFLAGADPGFDTVFLQNGGRLRGTVVEEDPTRGVTIQIPGGQVRTVPPAEVFRIEYRDGSLGALGAHPPPPAAAPAAPERAVAPPAEPSADQPLPPPAPPAARSQPDEPPGDALAGPRAAPPPPGWSGRAPDEPVRPLGPGRLRPPGPPPQLFMFAGGIGFMSPSGDAAAGVRMSDFVDSLFLLELEGGLRFTPHVMASLYLDLGFGEPARAEREFCRSLGGNDCSAISARIGLQLRYAFTPFAPVTPWVAVGFGGEATGVSFATNDSANDLTYSGREWRLSTGVDFRGIGQVGFGVFLRAGFGTYTDFEDYDGTSPPLVETRHTWIQAGVRAILFP